ncbi:hypothetical protein BSZ19_12450 [Bradyrhizobium japonicum]|uniref:Transcriptional regulator n=1 Tax=Bradyrhizobium japonicum TaxID=375 RepID=A0A1Y2JTN7_BRAJP|nr:hypothetical protein BSZ19_12450 [Bradyrhizobium japonicum]
MKVTRLALSVIQHETHPSSNQESPGCRPGCRGASPMYTPPAFRVVDIADLHRKMREARSATLITATHEGLVGAMLPVVLDERRLHRHHLCAPGEFESAVEADADWRAMAIFAGAQAYISPSWYVTMHDTGEPYVAQLTSVMIIGAPGAPLLDDALDLRRSSDLFRPIHALRRNGHAELKDGSARIIGARPHSAPVRLNNRMANGQTHARAFGFRGVKRLEHAVRAAWIESRTRIPKRDQYIIRAISPRSDQ